MVECTERPAKEIALLFDESSGSSAPQSFGAYRVLHQIGSGVLGPVFRSYDSQRDRLIAVKAFKIDIVPEDAQRLADALRPLCDGPSPDRTIVRLLETGMAGSTAYVAMEFATGESLDVALRHLAPAPLERALPLLEAIAGAIDTAWVGGLGHGALHPRDVIVAPGTFDVRVTGFGIRPALESLGVTTAPRRPYSAPERMAGEPWDIRADVYALGAIAHELLTGRRPLGSGEPEEATLLHRVLAKALAADPDDRFETGKAFTDALDAVAHSESEADVQAEEFAAPIAVASAEEAEEQDAEEADLPLGLDEPDVAAAAPADDIALAPAAAADEPIEPVERLDEPESVRHADAPPAGPARPRVPLPLATPTPRPGDSVWAPFMTQPLESLEPGAARRYPYPWGAIAAVAVASFVLGIAVKGALSGDAAVSPETSVVTVPPPAEGSQPRSETEVQVTPPAPASTAPAEAARPADITTQPSTTAPPPAAARATPPRPEAPVRTAAVAGRLVVRSVPSGALVTLDGRRMGETPLTLRDLPLGAHAVLVARPGYVPEKRSITLTTRAPAQTVSVPLRSGTTDRPAKTGSIYADTKPRAARVVIDGRAYGTTPVLVPELTPGPHTVRLEMDGYAPSSTSVTVKAGEQARVSISLVRR